LAIFPCPSGEIVWSDHGFQRSENLRCEKRHLVNAARSFQNDGQYSEQVQATMGTSHRMKAQ
jgi:hypothetical protein